MNLQDIKKQAYIIAKSKIKNAKFEAIEFFRRKVNEFYIKKTMYDKTKSSSDKWRTKYFTLKKEVSRVKVTMKILGLNDKKFFKKNEL